MPISNGCVSDLTHEKTTAGRTRRSMNRSRGAVRPVARSSCTSRRKPPSAGHCLWCNPDMVSSDVPACSLQLELDDAVLQPRCGAARIGKDVRRSRPAGPRRRRSGFSGGLRTISTMRRPVSCASTAQAQPRQHGGGRIHIRESDTPTRVLGYQRSSVASSLPGARHHGSLCASEKSLP
jgi:hypothetical protein